MNAPDFSTIDTPVAKQRRLEPEGMNTMAPDAPISMDEIGLINQLEQREGPLNEEERSLAMQEIDKLSKQGNAPALELTQQLASLGTGEDTVVAHLKPGEVVIPEEFMEDPAFEAAVEEKAKQFNIPPAHMTVDHPGGLMNFQTGAQEFGFFKKVGKFLKKVVTPIAKVAQFIPGPWMAPAALISKAATVRDVVRGDANPLALLSVAGPGAVGGSIGENIAGIKAAGSGSFLKGLGNLGGQTVSSIASGVMNPLDTLSKIPGTISSVFTGGQGRSDGAMAEAGGVPSLASTPADAMIDYQNALKVNPGLANMKGAIADQISKLQDAAYIAGETGDVARFNELNSQIAELQSSPFKVTGDYLSKLQDEAYIAGETGDIDRYNDLNNQIANLKVGDPMPYPESAQSYDQMIAEMSQRGLPGLGDDSQGMMNTKTQETGQGQMPFMGQQGSPGSFSDFQKYALATGLAGTLGKLAYDAAKEDKGIPLTPITTMDPVGRFNIEAEIARRTGQPGPNPVEFGLLPSGTFPTLSGAKPRMAEGGAAEKKYPNEGLAALAKVRPDVVSKMGFYQGGMVMPMAFAQGGPVLMQDGGELQMSDFPPMDRNINGPGTETSDDIPAMLSDGEFVMTSRAVRGAGKYQMESGANGVISLIPSMVENRERGMQLMNNMMDTFAGQAEPSRG